MAKPKPTPNRADDVAERTTQARAAIAANIRRRREERGLSQEALAESAELSAIYLAALEQARPTANPTLKALVAIAAALGCELGDLTQAAELERRPAGRPAQKPPLRKRQRANGVGKKATRTNPRD